MGGRKKGVEIMNLCIRLPRPVRDQLALEAMALGLPLGTYLRKMLEGYAPGVQIKDLAKKLAATSSAPDVYVVDK
jgi:hypothetical protein